MDTFSKEVKALSDSLDPTETLRQIIALSNKYGISKDSLNIYWNKKIKHIAKDLNSMEKGVDRAIGHDVSVTTKVCANVDCTQHGAEQQSSKFYKDRRNKDGLRHVCRRCFAKEMKKHRKK